MDCTTPSPGFARRFAPRRAIPSRLRRALPRVDLLGKPRTSPRTASNANKLLWSNLPLTGDLRGASRLAHPQPPAAGFAKQKQKNGFQASLSRFFVFVWR